MSIDRDVVTRLVETQDDLVQHLSAARWSLQSGDGERALAILDEALRTGQRAMSDLVRDAHLGSRWTGEVLGS